MKEKIYLNDKQYNVTDFYNRQDHRLTVVFENGVMIDDFLSNINDAPIRMYTAGYGNSRGTLCGEFVGWTTLYKRKGRTIILSDNGDVWEEPQPYVEPTPTLEEVKITKIEELRTICHQMIEAGVDVEIGGEIQHFSYTTEDQNNIKDAFDLAYQTGLSVPYHADGKSCALFTSEEITMVFIMNKTNLTHHTTYFNQMRMYVESLDDIETINAIQYGDPLIGEYFEDYTNMMVQAQLVITALLGLEEQEEFAEETLEDYPGELPNETDELDDELGGELDGELNDELDDGLDDGLDGELNNEQDDKLQSSSGGE